MITFPGPSRQRRTFRTDQSGSYVLGKTLINLSDELIYMRKTLIGSFNRNTCFERTAERTKNRSQQVFPTHTDCRKRKRDLPIWRLPCMPEMRRCWDSPRPPHRLVMARGRARAGLGMDF